MHTLRARYPSGYGSVRPARLALLALAERCGFGEHALIDIESAIGEALANAAEHGDRASAAGFAVDATCDDASFVVEIKDYGAGFDADAALSAPAPEVCSARGYGIFLMRALMDEVAYSERGTRVRLVKRATSRCAPLRQAPDRPSA
jgi:anti-sigma regulatory factor (Ser/Thr protein kinase)